MQWGLCCTPVQPVLQLQVWVAAGRTRGSLEPLPKGQEAQMLSPKAVTCSRACFAHSCAGPARQGILLHSER